MEHSVLVVDDDFMVARLHSVYVDRTPGFRTAGVAHGAAEAVRQAARLSPDLVLLDLYLPDGPGLEALRRIREVAPRTDFLVVSAAKDTETVRQAQRAGVVNYLIKPFEQAELRARLGHYRAARLALEGTRSADQAHVDRLFPVPGPAQARPRPDALPKGLSAPTASLVEGALRAAGPEGLSASECAAGIGLSRVSARRYLEHFVAADRAGVHLRYGTTGRPERRYTWRS
ncbi:response regulator [Streptomyces macrosporus]|uniref:Transcriptional regulatory protein n=1 Tax=Streptomyces macrosporus TaxID=44032 RepID=A0ABN3K4Y1_9ACTN